MSEAWRIILALTNAQSWGDIMLFQKWSAWLRAYLLNLQAGQQGGSASLRPAAASKGLEKRLQALESFARQTSEYLKETHNTGNQVFYETKLAVSQDEVKALLKQGFNLTKINTECDGMWATESFEMERACFFKPSFAFKRQGRAKSIDAK